MSPVGWFVAIPTLVGPARTDGRGDGAELERRWVGAATVVVATIATATARKIGQLIDHPGFQNVIRNTQLTRDYLGRRALEP